MIRISAKKNFNRVRSILALGVFSASLLFHGASLADVTAVFNAGGQEHITIEYRDDNHVRMSAPGGGYLIITGGEGYIAAQDGRNWTVFRFRDMAAMISRMGASMGAMGLGGDDINILDVDGTPEIRNTGRTETVAGISGEVYEVISTNASNGNREVTELVLSDHPDALSAYQGFMRITTMMGEMVGVRGLDALMDDTYGLAGKAILRADNDWVLTSVNRGNIPDANFVLPAQPMDMPNIPGFGGGQSGGGQSAGAGIGAWLGGEVGNAGQVASDEAESVVEEAAQEARGNVTDGIRQGVRRGLRGLLD
jgi:hypothetical protein